MQAGAFALLLIGAVNLTNLLLIRASSRVKETAIRQALGASRLHVVSEVVVETTLLTLAGGLLGLAAGAGGIRLLGVLGPIVCLWGVTSPSTPAWHASRFSEPSSWDSRSRCP